MRVTVLLLTAFALLAAANGRPKIPERILNRIRASPAMMPFYKSSFDQLEYIFNDNQDAVAVLRLFFQNFNKENRRSGKKPKGKGLKIGQEDLSSSSSASISNRTAAATSSDTYSGRKTLIISGSNGQFVRNPADKSRDSMRVYNIGEIMIEGVVAFVEVQATLLRNGNFYLDTKINEHNDGLIETDDGIYIDSKTISRKVILYDKKIGFGASEIYVVMIGIDSVDFKLYTIASGLSIEKTKVVSSVIIEIKHVQFKKNGEMTVEQATLTSTSDCNFEEKCKVVNLGSIKVNGDLLSKLVQAKAISGVDFEKKAAVVSQMYKDRGVSSS